MKKRKKERDTGEIIKRKWENEERKERTRREKEKEEK